jgi:hypothetical protein
MTDTFASFSGGLESPGFRHYVITPGPDDLSPRPRAVWINTSGTATVVDAAGTSVTYNLVAGSYLTFRAVKVTAATAELVAQL